VPAIPLKAECGVRIPRADAVTASSDYTMINSAWKTWLKRASQSLLRRDGQQSKRTSRRIRSCRPWLERLEDRTLLSVTLENSYPGLGFASSGGTTVPPDT
jgi:hypothetical protein